MELDEEMMKDETMQFERTHGYHMYKDIWGAILG